MSTLCHRYWFTCKDDYLSIVEFAQVNKTSAEESRHSRHSLVVTQAKFADRWVGTGLVTSLEAGRRAITERSRREIAQIFRCGGAPRLRMYRKPPYRCDRRAPSTAARGVVRSLTLLELLRGFSGKVRNRRFSPIAVRPREGPLTERAADAQPRRLEPVFMRHSCHSRHQLGSAQLGGSGRCEALQNRPRL